MTVGEKYSSLKARNLQNTAGVSRFGQGTKVDVNADQCMENKNFSHRTKYSDKYAVFYYKNDALIPLKEVTLLKLLLRLSEAPKPKKAVIFTL